MRHCERNKATRNTTTARDAPHKWRRAHAHVPRETRLVSWTYKFHSEQARRASRLHTQQTERQEADTRRRNAKQHINKKKKRKNTKQPPDDNLGYTRVKRSPRKCGASWLHTCVLRGVAFAPPLKTHVGSVCLPGMHVLEACTNKPSLFFCITFGIYGTAYKRRP